MIDSYRFTYSTRTEGDNEINTIYWTVPNFTPLLDSHINRELRTDKSKDYTNNACNATKFQLKMQFIGRENDLIEIYFQAAEPTFLKSVLSVCLNCYNERTLVSKDYFKVQPSKWQFLAVLFKRDVLNFDAPDVYLNEGSLHLKFMFIVNTDIKVNHSNMSEPQLGQLSQDFQNLLHNTMFYDLTMKSTDGEEFHVHKVVLATRSAVLKAHFEHNTLETMTNIIESPLESEVLQEVLTYIYTDMAPKVNEMPEKLLGAADFYQMSRLKSLCEEALHKNLTVENAIETLELADRYSATNLKRMTLEFINDGQARLIIKTKSWERIQSVPLIKTIFEYILNSGQMEEDLR